MIRLEFLPSILTTVEEVSIKSRRFAIFSATIDSKLRSYVFYTPIAAAAWQRIGYEVIVIFVGDFTKINSKFLIAQLNLTESFLRRLNVHIIHFQCNKSYSIKISQLVRIFSGYLSKTIVNDKDYILTTDSDIIPIQEEDYQLNENKTGFIYNAFCCGSFQRRGKSYQMYPMSHICIQKKIWRDLFMKSIQHKELLQSKLASSNKALLTSNAPLTFELISLYTRHEFSDLFDSDMKKGDAAWYMDQIYSSILINDYLANYPNIQIDKRYKQSKRLGSDLPNHMWQIPYVKQYGDAHIIHDEIFDSYRWSIFKHLINYLFNPTLANDIEFYYKQFTLLLHDKPEEF